MWLDIVTFIDELIHDATYGHMPAYAFMDVVCYSFNHDNYGHGECPCQDVREVMSMVDPGLDVF